MTNKERKKEEQKWEKILSRYGLSIKQPMTDNSEGEMAEVEHAAPNRRGTGRGVLTDLDAVKLRRKVDGGDVFLTGHQITKVRSMDREIPEWAFSDEKVQALLLSAFPKLLVDSRQRTRAGQWARAIYLYYRMRLPRQIVTREMKMNEVSFKRLIQKIGYVSEGLTATGKPRVRKTVSPLHHPSRESERKDGKRI